MTVTMSNPDRGTTRRCRNCGQECGPGGVHPEYECDVDDDVADAMVLKRPTPEGIDELAVARLRDMVERLARLAGLSKSKPGDDVWETYQKAVMLLYTLTPITYSKPKDAA